MPGTGPALAGWLAAAAQGEPLASLSPGPPWRKGRDETRLFLCRLPGSTCAACGFLGTRGPRLGLALPAACLELDRSGLGLQARVSACGEEVAGMPPAVGKARPGARDPGRPAAGGERDPGAG